MRTFRFLFIATSVLLTVSCAHKSGHKSRHVNSPSSNYEINDSKQSVATHDIRRNLEVTVSDKRHNKNKLDKSKIFTNFNKAGLMVLT